MNIILQNPYRTLGLLVGESATKLNRHRTRIPNYLIAGNDIPTEFTEYSFDALGKISRKVEYLSAAVSKLNLDNDKIGAAIFWFYNGNPITDEPAFDALKVGDFDQAINIWTELIINNSTNDFPPPYYELTKRNASAYFNLGTLYLSGILESKHIRFVQSKGIPTYEKFLGEGILLKLSYLESDFIKEFKGIAADETYNATKKEIQLLFLSQLQSQIESENSVSKKRFFELINRRNFTAKEDFLKLYIKMPIEQIEKELEIAENERKANKSDGIDIGKKLINQIENNCQLLQSILGINNIKFISISDKIANEILNCGIGYFNYYIESEFIYPGVETLDLCNHAEKYALGNVVKLRCKENIEIVGESVKRRPIKNDITIRRVGDMDDLNFAENAWWILGIVGILYGASAGGGGAFLGAIIGAGIGLIIRKSK